jgi:hypothetical protein
MVGAEGFEGSFPSDRYAVFFVRFNCKTAQFEGLAGFLKRTLLSRIFSPMDSFSQEIRITSYHLIAPKNVQMSLKSGLKVSAPPARKREVWSNFQIGNYRLQSRCNGDPKKETREPHYLAFLTATDCRIQSQDC